ncbi:MAG: hypothetical protein HC913_00075 [Microscillaceae bacterium]|nr:hypothetical protein [Microscillaceae bacterium]
MWKIFLALCRPLQQLFFLSIGLWACQSTVESDPSVLGYTFFPLFVGQFIEYEVEEIQFSLSAPPDTLRYELREFTERSFLDVDDELAFRLERYKRANASQAWELDSVWFAKRTPFFAQKSENNALFNKLAFPVREGLTWQGNAFSPIEGDTSGNIPVVPRIYEMLRLRQPLSTNSLSFPQTLTVIQNNINGQVGLDFRAEVYAENVGLIELYSWQLKYPLSGLNSNDPLVLTCNPILDDFHNNGLEIPQPVPVTNTCILSGRLYTQKIINYGQIP